MKLSILLAQRQALLEQARLANLAFAYETLSEFAGRIARAQLRGHIALKQAAPDAERCWASLTALEGNQSVIEEHFTDEDIAGLADLAERPGDPAGEATTFRLEEMAAVFVTPLRRKLEQAGVDMEGAASVPGLHNREGPARR